MGRVFNMDTAHMIGLAVSVVALAIGVGMLLIRLDRRP
jgi:hypothetical protein